MCIIASILADRSRIGTWVDPSEILASPIYPGQRNVFPLVTDCASAARGFIVTDRFLRNTHRRAENHEGVGEEEEKDGRGGEGGRGMVVI